MRVIGHVTKFFDWVPVPSDVKVTPADIAAERVRPSADGGYRMKVTRQGPTHFEVQIPEEQVIAKIIHERCRPEGGRVLTRKQAIAFYVGEEHLRFHAKREWITKFEVHDDGPDEKLVRAMLAPHGVAEADRVAACKVAGKHSPTRADVGAPLRCANCGHMPTTVGGKLVDDPSTDANIPTSEHAAHVAAYLEPADAKALVEHLSGHFRVKVAAAASETGSKP